MTDRINRTGVGTDTGRKVRAVGWQLASSVGVLSIVVVGAGTALIVTSGTFGIGQRLTQLVPQAWIDFFHREDAISVSPALAEKARATIATAAAARREHTSRRVETFTVGDSEKTVLRVQGEPTRRAGDVWHYGESQVIFVAGRVVGWNNASRYPLHIR